MPDNENAIEEVVNPQDVETQANEDGAQEPDVSKSESQRPSETDQERNWRAMRQSQEQLNRQNDELKRQNDELINFLKKSNAPKEEPDEIDLLADDDILTKAQMRKLVERDAKKVAKELLAQELAQRENANAPQRLKQQFPDFDEVVSKENVDYLIKNEPEIAATLKANNNEYAQAVAAYKYIKNSGIYKMDNPAVMKQDALRNSAKPVSPNAVGVRSSLSDANVFANGLTPDLKNQLYKEMLAAIDAR